MRTERLLCMGYTLCVRKFEMKQRASPTSFRISAIRVKIAGAWRATDSIHFRSKFHICTNTYIASLLFMCVVHACMYMLCVCVVEHAVEYRAITHIMQRSCTHLCVHSFSINTPFMLVSVTGTRAIRAMRAHSSASNSCAKMVNYYLKGIDIKTRECVCRLVCVCVCVFWVSVDILHRSKVGMHCT